MAKNTNTDQVTQKWQTNFGGAGQAVKDGVQGVTVSPMELAAKQIDYMRQRFNAAVDSGKVLRGLQKRDLSYWKNAVLTKGISRMQQGAAAGAANYKAFAQRYLPFIRQRAAQIAQMPKGGMANALARVQANLQALSDFANS